MTDLTLEQMKDKASKLSKQATLHAVHQLMQQFEITVDDLLEYFAEGGEGCISDAQKLQDHRKRTANSNATLVNLARARQARGQVSSDPEPVTVVETPAAPPVTSAKPPFKVGAKGSDSAFDIQL